MKEHDSDPNRQEQLIEEILAGDRGPEDPEVRDAAQADPAFAKRIGGLRAVADLLDQTAEDARTTFREAQTMAPVAGEDRVLEVLHSDRKVARGRLRWYRRPLALAMMAASLLATVVIVREQSKSADPHGPPQIVLGSDQVQLLGPRGAGTPDGFERVTWSGELPSNGEFRITVSDETDGQPSAAPLLQHRTTEFEWLLTAAERERLPDRIWVQIAIHGPDGRVLATDGCAAQR